MQDGALPQCGAGALRVQSGPTQQNVDFMSGIFGFGEQIDGYPVRVLNERAVRAGAGIVFLFAMAAFMNAWLVGNFQPTRVFVVAFLVDFTIRIFVNPRFAPSLILGQWFVRKQQPEYVGAPQKRFAWGIGLALGLSMLYLLVIKQVIGPINMLVCATCLVLMFFETAFGICIGCKLYNVFNKEQAQLCPGGACAVSTGVAPPGAGRGWAQAAVLVAFLGVVGAAGGWVAASAPQAVARQPQAASSQAASADPAEAERCKVPAFAKALGHEDKWKLHNNCT